MPSLFERVRLISDVRNTVFLIVLLVFICSFFALLKDWTLIHSLIVSKNAGVLPQILLSSLSTLVTGYSVWLQITFIIGVVLLAFNFMLVLSYARRMQGAFSVGGRTSLSMIGALVFFLGFQCFSCVVIFGLFSTPLFLLSIFHYLPLQGGELSILSLVVLGASTVLLFKKVTDPLIC